MLRKKDKSKKSSAFAFSGACPKNLYKSSFSSFSDAELYENMRLKIPVIDGAIRMITRLAGGFNAKTENGEADELLSSFLQNVRVNGLSRGIDSFTDRFFGSLLTYGMAVASIKQDDLGEIELKNEDAALFRVEDDKLFYSGNDKPLDGMLVALHEPDARHRSGRSVLSSLPFVSGVLMQIFDTVGRNWERLGSPRFAVSYRPPEDCSSDAKSIAEAITGNWTRAMRSAENARDIVTVGGNLDVKVIGSDASFLEPQVPSRLMLEQICAALNIPPFLLGFSWSTSEKQARVQTDIFASSLSRLRAAATPTLIRICRTYLRSIGVDSGVKIEWNAVSLQDKLDEARADYFRAGAESKRAV